MATIEPGKKAPAFSLKDQDGKTHRLSDYAVIRDFPSPGPKPTALCSDGAYLWSIDSELGKIYQHAVADGAFSIVFSKRLFKASVPGAF